MKVGHLFAWCPGFLQCRQRLFLKHLSFLRSKLLKADKVDVHGIGVCLGCVVLGVVLLCRVRVSVALAWLGYF